MNSKKCGKSRTFATLRTVAGGLAVIGLVGCNEFSKSSKSSSSPSNNNANANGTTTPSPTPSPTPPVTPVPAPPAGPTPAQIQQTITSLIGSEPSTGSFLTAADTQPPTGLTSILATEIGPVINSQNNFFSNVPGTDAADTCLDAAFANFKVTATSTTLTADFNDNNDQTLINCMNQEDSNISAGITFTDYQVRLYSQSTCPSFDLSQYNGDTYATINNLTSDPCNVAGTTGETGIVEYQITMATQANAATGVPAGVTVIKVLNATAGLTACQSTVANGLMVSNACINTTSVTRVGAGETSDFTSYTANQLAADNASPYYASGSYTFTIDNWSGTMTYTGLTTAPTWTATASGQNASGTFTPTSANTSGSAAASTPATSPSSGTGTTSLALTASSVQPTARVLVAPHALRLLPKWWHN